MPKKHPFAFPSEKTTPAQPGMNLRDYFAARFAANDLNETLTSHDVARLAYERADAMMAVRDEQ